MATQRISAVTHRHDSLLVSVTTTITPNQERALEAYCKAKGICKSEALRGLIEAELSRVIVQPPVVQKPAPAKERGIRYDSISDYTRE